jgi:hypothetical protein|nr:MAG TPA: SOS-response transcriptional repressor [Caudoviricetes sp.]
MKCHTPFHDLRHCFTESRNILHELDYSTDTPNSPEIDTSSFLELLIVHMNYLSLNKLAVSNIRALLGARRESIEALAGATKIPLSTLKRRLLNKSPFTLEEIEQIAKHFAVAASDLISPSIAIPALAEGKVA